MAATTETKYILHYQYWDESVRKHRQTFRKLESAISDMKAYRSSYRRNFKENDMWYHDHSGQVTDEKLEWMIEHYIYIEKQVITSERMAL